MVVVSVLVIAGTGRPYLADALRSLVVQDFQDWEAIVVEACRDPADAEKVEKQLRAVSDPRIRVFRYDRDDGVFPPYASRKWNFALRHTTGQFVAFLDDDDMKDGGWVMAMCGPLLEDPNLSTTVCAGTCIDKDGARQGNVFGAPALDRASLLRAGFVTTGQLMVRRSTLDAVGGLNEDLGCSEDYDLCISLSSFPWKKIITLSLKRDLGRGEGANACYHPDVCNHTQVSLRRILTKHGVIDQACSRCRGPLEDLPIDVASGGWHWKIAFNGEKLGWEVFAACRQDIVRDRRE